MKFVHTADLHLGMVMKHATFASSDAHLARVYELEAAFYRLLDHVKESKTDYLFITGDLFDHPHVGITKVESFFKRLSELDTETFIVIGNHDTFLHNEAYKYLNDYQNIHFFDANHHVVHLDNIDVYGMNTRDFSVATLTALNASLNTSKINVLCLHGDLYNPKDDHYLTDIATLAQTNFDYIALGHIHKHAFLKPHIAYSGNLEPVDFSETSERGFIEGTLSKPVKAHFVPFATRHFIVREITLTPDDNSHTLRQKLDKKITEEEKNKDFIRIELHGVVDKTFVLNAALFDDIKREYYYIEFKDKTRVDLDLETLKRTYKDTLIAHLIEDAEKDNTLDDESLLRALRVLLETEAK